MCALTYLLLRVFFKLLICMNAYVVFNCYLFLWCVCRSKAHYRWCCVCCFEMLTLNKTCLNLTSSSVMFQTSMKPKLESITLCQWSMANISIMYKLLENMALNLELLCDYMSDTKRIYQLVTCYDMPVIFYDREYTSTQISLDTYVLHLVFCSRRSHQHNNTMSGFKGQP